MKTSNADYQGSMDSKRVLTLTRYQVEMIVSQVLKYDHPSTSELVSELAKQVPDCMPMTYNS